MSKRLLQAGIWMSVMSVLSGTFGYVFQILMGRMLSLQDFALFSAIMSIVAIMTSPISAVFTVVSRNVTQAFVSGVDSFVRGTYNRLNRIALSAIALLIICATVFGADIGVYVKNSTTFQMVLLAGMIGATAIGMLNSAYLQAGQKFAWLAGSGLSSVLLKIIISTSLVWLGLGINGALSGFIVATMFVNIVVMIVIRRLYPPTNLEISTVERVTFSFSGLFPVLIANLAISVMTQLDILLVNNYFSPSEAGKYAAAATLGKAILYLPSGLVFALFPMVAEAQARAMNVTSYILTASGMTLAMCMAVVFSYWFLGQDIIQALFGQAYAGTEDILKYYSIAMLPMALLIVTEYFYIALGKVVYAWLSFIFAPLQVILIYFNHDSLLDVITIVGSSGFLLLLSGYLYGLKRLRPV